MPFLTAMQLESIRGTDRFVLLAPLIYAYKGCNIRVETGFSTDFASIPKPLQGFLNNDAGCVRDAAVIHDWLYCTKSVPRHVADLVLKKGMLELGAKGYQAWIVYIAVRLFGNAYWDKK